MLVGGRCRSCEIGELFRLAEDKEALSTVIANIRRTGQGTWKRSV